MLLCVCRVISSSTLFSSYILYYAWAPLLVSMCFLKSGQYPITTNININNINIIAGGIQPIQVFMVTKLNYVIILESKVRLLEMKRNQSGASTGSPKDLTVSLVLV